jgi:hypothetical protein
MGVYPTQVQDHQEHPRAQKEQPKHQREDAEEGTHRT